MLITEAAALAAQKNPSKLINADNKAHFRDFNNPVRIQR
jgi:hypothetical protein